MTWHRARRLLGWLLLAGGLLALLGIAMVALLGFRPFEPLWAFLASATAMAGAVLRQHGDEAAGTGDPVQAVAAADGGGTGAGDAGPLPGEVGDADGGGDGSE
ncbi:hypothetical protein [Roseicella aerolata]|uniref:Uncharacterized protein n=1 Tax=Roseicella aerolata TaxID=2883479 RepID=A0A9X1IDS7_9PROT|nr:hypothetical protein [Roseicella aerolata]MCB4821443.1 hypothetical protein [Roseicella aerolata]